MSRAGAIAKVHVAKKQMPFDDETYRAVLHRVTGKTSTGEMNEVELGNVIGEFVRLGWKGGSSMRMGRTKTGRLIRRLWKEASREKSETSLRTMIRRVLSLDETVIPDPDLLSADDASKVIEAVKGLRKGRGAAGR